MDSDSTINVHSCFVFKYVFIKTPTQFLLADVAMAGMKAQQSKVCQTSKSLQSPALAPGPPETSRGRDKFDWGPRQPEAGAEAAAVLRSSEHLDVPHFKIEINYPHKVEVSRTWR